MICWICKKREVKPPNKICERCSADLQSEIQLSPMESSTPLTHDEWLDRGGQLTTTEEKKGKE
jgi:hypothetical protein